MNEARVLELVEIGIGRSAIILEIRQDVSDLKNLMYQMNGRALKTEDRVQLTEDRLQRIEDRMQLMEDRMQRMEDQMHKMGLQLEFIQDKIMLLFELFTPTVKKSENIEFMQSTLTDHAHRIDDVENTVSAHVTNRDLHHSK